MIGALRYVVERTLACFSHFRRLRMCYERTAEHFQAFHDIAACCLTVTRLRRYADARAWLEDDRLQHVRRWPFTQPISYSRQVRRLIMEATGNVVLARDEAVHALAWAEAAS